MDRGRIVLSGTPRQVFGHARELRELGVDSPRMARVHNSLVEKGLLPPGEPCLTVSEAESLVEGLVWPHLAGGAQTDPAETRSATWPSGQARPTRRYRGLTRRARNPSCAWRAWALPTPAAAPRWRT